MPIPESENLSIYNSLTGKKEIFTPLNANLVGMYVCGPTVYSYVHLGNCRTFVSFDLVYRYLLHLGYNVRYVRNITDAGHLENDGESGEDPILRKARLEHLEPMEVVQKYTVDFHKVLTQFNTLPPSIEPTATGHIIEQIETVKKIIAAGYGYETNGSVYFDVIKFNNDHEYGRLSGRKLEDMIPNTRELTAQSDKQNPQDFALWKKAEPQHIMRWPSPWSLGFPGWHLECTAMSAKYLGEQFDIHGGGMDLKFPHHECEIAQGEAANEGKNPVRFWMHANMLSLNGSKMSKSTGNFILPGELFSGENDLLGKAFDARVVRFFMLQAHYRSVMDFSGKALKAVENGFNRLREAVSLIDILETSEKSEVDINSWKQRCYEAMNDDFNSPMLIAELFEATKWINSIYSDNLQINTQDLELLRTTFHGFLFDVLGIEKDGRDGSAFSKANTGQLNAVMELLIEVRDQARVDKDFALSDKIRNRLAEAGIQLNDGNGKTTFKLN